MNLQSLLENKLVFAAIYVIDMAIWLGIGYYLGVMFK
jgi:histidyl-tRNA synthetase